MYATFAKGVAVGMIAGGAVGAIIAMPKKHVTAAGRLMKAAGNMMENICDAFKL